MAPWRPSGTARPVFSACYTDATDRGSRLLKSMRFGLALAAVVALAGPARAETFDLITYTPPAGWPAKAASDAKLYVRSSGVGAIAIYASVADTDFATLWKLRVEPVVRVGAPAPQVSREGDVTIAIGASQSQSNNGAVTVALAAITRAGRTMTITTLTSGDAAFAEASAFLETIRFVSAPPSQPQPAGAIEVEFAAPSGYAQGRDGNHVTFAPAKLDEKTPCAYAIAPARASTGDLERDALNAFADVLPGWQVRLDRYTVQRGIAPAGWSYRWIRTDANNGQTFVNAMTMAFPAGPGRVNIVWGLGSNAHCMLDDRAFAQLFHSLKPRGWKPDYTAFARDLQHGMWRYTNRVGLLQYKFLANGRYEFGMGTVTNMGTFERQRSSVADGAYSLRDGAIVLSPDRGGTTKLYLRGYEEQTSGGGLAWRKLEIVDAASGTDVEYEWIQR